MRLLPLPFLAGAFGIPLGKRLMLRRSHILLAYCALLLPAFGENVQFYDSTGDPIRLADGVSMYGPEGFSFTTLATTANLTDVKLSLNGAGSGSGSVSVALYSNNGLGPQPGSLLASIGVVKDTAINGNVLYDLPMATPYALAANTRYWILLTPSNGTVLGLNWSLADAGPGVPSEYTYSEQEIISNSHSTYIGLVDGTTAGGTPFETELAPLGPGPEGDPSPSTATLAASLSPSATATCSISSPT